jgi:flagellar basal-body rod modification protein FlgD
MDVASSASAGLPAGGTQISSNAQKSTLDYNSFLTLLVAQLKFQDPTAPQDSTQFISQLASFSGVEQAVNTNSKLDNLITSFALSQADGVIGHTVTAADGSISGKATSVKIMSDGATAVLESGDQIPLGAGVVIS